MRQIRKDEVFFYHSGGGVTISGGDVLLQADFARELLIACKNEEIHTAAELDLFGSYDEAAKLLPWLSEVFIDIKVMDPEKHFIWTGVRNTTILANAVRLAAEYRGKLHIRVPLIPGVSDNSENIQKTVEFCRGLSKCEDLEFLPYHRLGTDTYQRIGRSCLFKDVPSMTREEAEKKVSFLCRENLPFPVKVSGKEIFR
jgi:pyruvate formate lyase activating enzyme